MRSYKTIIIEAELLASSPESVHQYLKARASKSKDELWADPVDRDTEEALRLRQEPFVDLSLAMHARYVNTVKPLFSLSEPGSPIRLAILSNRAFGTTVVSRFPGALFANPKDLEVWLTDAPSDEIAALFQNPAIDEGFLGDLLEGKKQWAQIPDDRMGLIVAMLANNERMSTPKDFDEGWADHMYHRVFDQAWALAERVKVTDDWAMALSWLYDKLERQCHSIKDPLQVAKRWYPPLEAEKEDHGGSATDLSSYEHVRQGLARLAMRTGRDTVFKELLASDDRALRAAAYTDGPISIPQLQAAYAKDKGLAFNQAVLNKSLWKSQAARNELREIARRVSQDDEAGDRMPIRFYDKVHESMEKNHPEWFKEDNVDKFYFAEDDAPATKSDLRQVSDKLTHPNSQPHMAEIQKHMSWLLMMCGFLVVFVVFKHW